MKSLSSQQRRISVALLALTMIAGSGEVARADGGRLVRVERTNGWIVSVFVAPDPPRVGPVDVSVLVQEEASGSVIADADIAVTATLQTDPDLSISAPASRRQATNKLLQSALLSMPTAGDWHGTIQCNVEQRKAQIPFELQVEEAPPIWSKLAPWFLWPIGGTAIFIAHRAMSRHRHRMRFRSSAAASSNSIRKRTPS